MDPLRSAAGRDPGAPALAAEERRWSYGELDAWVDRIVLRLHEAGVGPGAIVGMVLPPSPEAVALIHAVPRAGGVLLPLNPGLGEEERRRAIASVGGTAVLVEPPVEEWVGEDALAGLAGGFGESVAAPDPDTPLVLILTSGSTGRPRPVPLTRGNLEASAQGAIERLRLDASDRWLASLSPAHVGGLALVHRAAVVGCELVTRPRFDARELVQLIESGRVTHASLVPTMLERLLDAWETGATRGGRGGGARGARGGGARGEGARGEGPGVRGLRALLIGGAPTRGPLLGRALAARFPVALTYGLTEATSQVTTAPPDRVRERFMDRLRGGDEPAGAQRASSDGWSLGARPIPCGRPLPGVELRIFRPGEHGVGEIQLRGPTVAPLAPSEGGIGVGIDGWLRTGDLGRIDEEGELEVMGRLSDRIVTGGVTIEPAEVEELLLRHPGVAEVAVVGLPDEEWGERVVAFVVRRSGEGSGATDEQLPTGEAMLPTADAMPPTTDALPPTTDALLPTTDALLAFTAERISTSKRPREVRFVEALPRNANGKVDRRKLRAE